MDDGKKRIWIIELYFNNFAHDGIGSVQQKTANYFSTFYSSNVTYCSSFSRESFVRCARKGKIKGKKKHKKKSDDFDKMCTVFKTETCVWGKREDVRFDIWVKHEADDLQKIGEFQGKQLNLF